MSVWPVGVEVPKDLSVVGFDDLEMARHLHPALTTMRVPTEAMWSTAADRLLGTLAGETPPRNTEVEVALVVRESTGPAPRA
ncbi:substrate-binding domain-containing protein [Variovorax humicola]|uniref:Substrate-binding domain-containing protein n=1 Tax=Variovorax humicola TaxID=1769758 RepID=A0ABU8W3C9_9BURK